MLLILTFIEVTTSAGKLVYESVMGVGMYIKAILLHKSINSRTCSCWYVSLMLRASPYHPEKFTQLCIAKLWLTRSLLCQRLSRYGTDCQRLSYQHSLYRVSDWLQLLSSTRWSKLKQKLYAPIHMLEHPLLAPTATPRLCPCVSMRRMSSAH